MKWRLPLTRGALLLMETLWIYALVAFLLSVVADDITLSLPGVAAVVFISFLISRALERSELDLGLVRIWGIGLSFLIFYAIVRIDLFDDWRLWDFSWADRLFANTSAATSSNTAGTYGIPLLWIFWMRGLAHGQQPASFDSIVRTFASGVVIIALVQLLSGGVDTPDAVGIITVPYIGLGLLAIGLAQAARAEEELGRSFSGTWVVAVGGSVLLLSSIALIFVFLDFSAMATGLGVAAEALAQGIAILLWPLIWAMAQFFAAIAAVIHFIFGTGEPFNPEPLPGPPAGGDDDVTSFKLPGWIWDVARGVLVFLFLSIVVAGVALMFRRNRKRQRSGDQAESIYEEGRLNAELGDLLGSLLGRLKPNLHFGDKTESVRRLYAELLDAGARRGVTRKPAQTPLELAPSLDRAFAAPTPGRITTVFDQARYGDIAVSAEDLKRLREEWQILQKENR